MSKKKMTPAQAAAARRPDDWEPPKTAKSTKKQKQADTGAVNYSKPSKSGIDWRMAVPFLLLIVVLSILAPFVVIYLSSVLGI